MKGDVNGARGEFICVGAYAAKAAAAYRRRRMGDRNAKERLARQHEITVTLQFVIWPRIAYMLPY
jgi:hypothetical protein